MGGLFNHFFKASILVLLICASCTDDDYDLSTINTDAEFNLSMVGPLGKSSITMQDLLSVMDVTDIKSDDNNVLYYETDTTFRVDLDPLELSVDELFSESFDANSSTLVDLSVYNQVTFIKYLDFSEEEKFADIDSILLKNVTLELNVESNVPELREGVSLKIFSNAITLNKELFPDDTIRIDNFYGKTTINLSGSFLRFNEELHIPFEMTIYTKNKNIQTTESSYLNIDCHCQDKITYKKVWGNLSSYESHKGILSTKFDLFDDLDESTIYPVDPNIFVSMWTNVGMPTDFRIDSFCTYKNDLMKYALFKNSQNPDGVPFYERKMMYSKNIGDRVLAFQDTFNQEKGDFGSLLSISPDSLDLKYTFNIGSKDGSGSYFATDSMFVDFDLGINVPAWLKSGSTLSMQDTIFELDLSSLSSDFDVDKLVLDMEFENALPFDVEMNLSFLKRRGNFDYEIIDDDLLNKKFKITAGIINKQTNCVISSTTTLDDIAVNNSNMEDLKSVAALKIEYSISVPNTASSVKVKSTDLLKAIVKFYLKGSM